MMGKPSTHPHAFPALKEHPYKRLRIMNTPPDDDFSSTGISAAKTEPDLISGHEAAITASWSRLLQQLQAEVKVVADAGSDIIPTIDFEDLRNPQRAAPFLRSLKTRGTAVIRNVIPVDDAASWNRTLEQYLADDNSYSTETWSPAEDGEEESPRPPGRPRDIFWSLAQLSARAHPNTLAAQRFLMSQCWHSHSHGPADHHPDARMSTRQPVTYADRFIVRSGGTGPSGPDTNGSPLRTRARLVGSGGGEVEAYRAIWSGWWEEHDPWDAAARLGASGGRDSVFRMFEGMLPLSMDPTAPAVMDTCPLPLGLTTAYQLLRPLFAPKRPPSSGPGALESFLSPSNWVLLGAARRPDLQGEEEEEEEEGPDISATSHPHLRLDETLIPLPNLAPGDYVVWHPDAFCPSLASASASAADERPSDLLTATLLGLPACPLTRANALFLARQRKAFVLGFPGPEFTSTDCSCVADLGSIPGGESCHLGRPGTQDIYEVGGEEALRSMGLLAWEHDGEDGELVEMANGILFPDRVGRPKGG